jgi:hypothetical protein
MNFHDTQTSRVLKQHYEKLLLSYDVYETGIYEEQTDISNQNELKKGNYSKTGIFIYIIFEYLFIFFQLKQMVQLKMEINKKIVHHHQIQIILIQ